MPTQTNRSGTCYLCGVAGKLTRDHIPPKCLFPRPRPSNLLTLPCCHRCNNSASKDDEYLRLATSGLINALPMARAAWDRVIASTIKHRRIAKLIDDLKGEIKPVVLSTPMGKLSASQFAIQAEPINRSLVRITRGILANTHPEVSTGSLDYEVTQIHQFKIESVVLSGIADTFPCFQLGDGIYTNWRAVSEDDHSLGLMVHAFYGAAMRMVQHEHGTGRISVMGAPGWSQSLTGGPLVKDGTSEK
jgi:hypothetical protein